jgi:SAM-dependent methyltransferase
MRAAGRSRPHAHRTYSEQELLARTEEFNRNAEGHWRSIDAEPAGRGHVLNKPFSTVRDTPGILYRLGLVLDALDLGVGHTVLDFGSGSCWLSSCINRLRCRTVSIDVSPTALKLGEELFRLDPRHHLELKPRFLAYDGHRIPLPDESVDRAVCFDAFHHVPNQDEVLRELFRVLKTGGRVVLAEPGEGHSHMDQSVYETQTHGVLENDLHLDELMQKAGNAGFGEFLMKPYPDAAAITLTATDYLRLVEGDDSVFPMHALQSSLRHFYIMVLTKGAPRHDSRNPRTLDARIALPPGSRALRAAAASTLRLEAQIQNVGDTTWLHQVDEVGGYVVLGGHLLGARREILKRGFLRAPLPHDVRPGESVRVDAEVPVPAELGRYIVQLDMVDEYVAWFEQWGSKAAEFELLVDSFLDSRDPHRLAADVELRGRVPEAVRPGARVALALRITNVGDTRWLHATEDGRGAVNVGAHLHDDASRALVAQDFFRIPLPRGVSPGEVLELECVFAAPPAPGRHRIRVDLVAEQVCWFEQHGSAPLEIVLGTTDETPDSAQPGVLKAEIGLTDAQRSLRIRCGAGVSLPVRIKNAGNTLWLHEPRPEGGHVALGGHLYGAGRSLLALDHFRSPLPRSVAPGESVEAVCRFEAPPRPGRYLLELDMVDEGIAWFGSRGSATVEVELRVD